MYASTPASASTHVNITRESASPPFSTWHDHSIRVGGSGAGAKHWGHPSSADHGLSCGGINRHHAGENVCVSSQLKHPHGILVLTGLVGGG